MFIGKKKMLMSLKRADKVSQCLQFYFSNLLKAADMAQNVCHRSTNFLRYVLFIYMV